jgi:CRP-like cAMP-binding protein
MMLSEGDHNFLLEHATVRRYRRRHVLFDQGDDATCLFVVLAGEVEICRALSGPHHMELKGFEGTFILWSVK